MRRVMSRCNNIDVMTSPSLEYEHYLCQILNASGIPLSFQADFMVYAKDTSKPAMSEEDRSRTSSSHKGRFLSEMSLP